MSFVEAIMSKFVHSKWNNIDVSQYMWPNALLQYCPGSNWEKQKEGKLMCMPCQEHRPRAQLMKTTMASEFHKPTTVQYFPFTQPTTGLSKSVVIKITSYTLSFELHVWNIEINCRTSKTKHLSKTVSLVHGLP